MEKTFEEAKSTPVACQETFPTDDGRGNRPDTDGVLLDQHLPYPPKVPTYLFTGANYSQPHSKKTGRVRKVEEYRFSASSGLHP